MCESYFSISHLVSSLVIGSHSSICKLFQYITEKETEGEKTPVDFSLITLSTQLTHCYGHPKKQLKTSSILSHSLYHFRQLWNSYLGAVNRLANIENASTRIAAEKIIENPSEIIENITSFSVKVRNRKHHVISRLEVCSFSNERGQEKMKNAPKLYDVVLVDERAAF